MRKFPCALIYTTLTVIKPFNRLIGSAVFLFTTLQLITPILFKAPVSDRHAKPCLKVEFLLGCLAHFFQLIQLPCTPRFLSSALQ